jgi:hypothetical protein
MPQPLLAQVSYRTFQAQHRPLQAQSPQNVSPPSAQTDIKNGMTTRRFLGWKYAAKAGKQYQALFNRPRAGMARPRIKTQVTGAMASQVSRQSRRQIGAQTFPGLAFRDSLPSGFIPTGVATGDFNGDGNADWVVSNAGDNDLWVYLGNGDGTASTPTILNLLGLGPLAVATGDLRGNGKIDIVVAEADSGTIEVFLGNGDGTFAPGSVYPLNGMPTFVVLADFNKDGKLEVAVSEFGHSPIAFLAGNGDGTLSAPVYDSWGQGLPQLVTIQAIDLDNDGALDLVYFDIEGAGVVGVALGHGDGTFSPGTIVAGNPFVQSLAVAAGDVDEDGCADIVLVDEFSTAEVYKGNCDGTFSPVPNLFETGAIGVSVALRDTDGDGHLDIVAASDYFPLVSADDAGNLLSVLKGDGHGRFAPATVFRADPGMYSFAFLNLRGSSLPSIVAASEDSDAVTVFKNDGTGDFGQPRGRSIGYNGGTQNSPLGDFKFADLNQDHRPDLLALELPQYSPGNYEIVTVLNQGNGKFSAPIHSIFFPDSLTSSGPGDYALGDFRNTGHLDAVAVGALGGGSLATPFLAFSAGNGDGTFAAPTIVTPPTAEGVIGVGDFNRDGKLDFVTLNFTYPQQTLNVFLGNGDGTFRPEPPIVYGGSEERWPVSVYVADFNGDGKLDVLVYLYLNVVPFTINDVYVFYGNGDGTFQQPVKLYSNSDPFTLVDVNHDGIPDIVTCRFQQGDYPNLTPVSTSVMLGTGAGGFGPPTTYQTYPGYSRLPTTTGTDWGGQGYCTVGDFNGDGNIDIGVMQWDGFYPIRTYVQFLSGNGDGTFTPTYNMYSFEKPNVPQGFFDLDGYGSTGLIEMDVENSSFNFVSGTTAQVFQFENVTEPIIGNIGSAQVSLNVPASSDTIINLHASDPGLQIPGTVTVPAGSLSQQFTYTVTEQADVHHVFKISATLGTEEEDAYNFVLTDQRVITGCSFSLNMCGWSVYQGATSPDCGPGYQTQPNYATTLEFSCSGLPPGIICDFEPSSATLGPGQGGISSMFVKVAMCVVPGTYPFQAIASDPESAVSYPASITVLRSDPQGCTTTAVTSSPNPSRFGVVVNITATVGPSGPPAPTGTVSFTSNGTAISGCTAVPLGSLLTAVCTTSTLAVGTDAIVATYSGDANYTPSSGTLAQLVNPTPSPLQFVAVTPCRLVDTRQTGGAIQGGSSRDFPVQQEGGCNIPDTAAAYSLNVTVVPQGQLGYLTIWPTGEGRPVVSTLNSADGRVKANAAIVPAGTSGEVSVYVTNTANVVLDIDGYFAPVSGSTLAFYPLPPCRVADTRDSTKPPGLGPPQLSSQTPRAFPVLNSTCIPTGVNPAAYSFNFTVVPGGHSVGYLSVWPTGQNQPVVSTLNDQTGTIVANAAIVPAGSGGEVSVYATDNTQLVIDIDGYFAPAGQGGLSLYAVAPCRVIDTRHVGNGQPFTGTLTPPVDVEHSQCGPPATAQAYVFNATVIPPGGLGYLTLWPDGENQPVVSTLNAADGSITNNMAIVPTSNGKVDAFANGLTQLILDISNYFAP